MVAAARAEFRSPVAVDPADLDNPNGLLAADVGFRNYHRGGLPERERRMSS